MGLWQYIVTNFRKLRKNNVQPPPYVIIREAPMPPTDINGLSDKAIRFGDGRYKYESVIGKGGFGIVMKVRKIDSGELLALKLERKGKHWQSVENELGVYLDLGAVEGFPHLHDFFEAKNCIMLVLTLMGPSLTEYRLMKNSGLSEAELFYFAAQMIQLVRSFHKIGFVHCDLKPSNFVLGTGNKKHKLHLIDFGLAKRYINSNFVHCEEGICPPCGTLHYMSINTHYGLVTTRRDDLESVFYTLLSLGDLELPWLGHCFLSNRNSHRTIASIKNGDTNNWILYERQEYREMFEYVKNLDFKETPNYHGLIELFELTEEMKTQLENLEFPELNSRDEILTPHEKNLVLKFAMDPTTEVDTEESDEQTVDDFSED